MSSGYFKHRELLQRPPVKRAAYSDRTAWFMAELSRLAYERLPTEMELDTLLTELRQAFEKHREPGTLRTLIKQAAEIQKGVAKSTVETVLENENCEMFDTCAIDGTELFIARVPEYKEFNFPGMFVIVFRGTQTKSPTDLKTDIKANLVDAPGGGRVHCGFLLAYQKIEGFLEQALEKAEGLPVYIAGHSLGGALAMLTTRYLANDSVGATYTFGCPRVGDDDFYDCVKTPVYRVVNCADLVARIPFGMGFTLLLSAFRIIPINGTKRLSEFLRKRFAGYTHHGHHVMLPGTLKGEKDRIIPSPSIFLIFWELVKQYCRTGLRGGVTDHSIAAYCQKLGVYALRRNR